MLTNERSVCTLDETNSCELTKVEVTINSLAEKKSVVEPAAENVKLEQLSCIYTNHSLVHFLSEEVTIILLLLNAM